MREIIRSKIHKATVTGADVNYVGSIGIDKELIEKSGIMVGEKVLVADLTNGARLETYVIEKKAGSRVIEMNGAAAHLIKPGDQVIIMGFELTDKPIEPKIILVDQNNKFVRYL